MTRSKKHNRKKTPVFWVILSLGLVGLAVYAGIYLEQNTVIREVRFSGNEFTEDRELYNAVDSLVGLPADSLVFPELFKSIGSLPYVSGVTVNMNFHGTLTFQITEREPIALLVDGNRQIYVGEGGIKLPVIPGKVRNVPLLYGFSAAPAADTLDSESYNRVEAFLTAARANETGWATISEVAWDDNTGVVALTHENGVKLMFGKSGFRERLLYWETFYREVVTYSGIHSFSSIDLRFRDQIVTKNL